MKNEAEMNKDLEKIMNKSPEEQYKEFMNRYIAEGYNLVKTDKIRKLYDLLMFMGPSELFTSKQLINIVLEMETDIAIGPFAGDVPHE